MFLGAAYLATGVMSLIFAVAYLAITVLFPRKFGDTSRLRKPQPQRLQPNGGEEVKG